MKHEDPVSFEHVLKDHLSDPDQAAKYLTACYEEGSDVFLQALRDVVEAQGGMTRAARLAGLNRESLYRQLSRRGNPSLASLNAVLSALGLKLVFYSKIAPWLENLQQQAIFDGAFFQTSKCSDKF